MGVRQIGIRDKLEEQLSVEKPTLFIFEWIPFDINVFEEMAEEIEAKEKERGILLTDEIDSFPEKAIFEKVPAKAMVSVIKYEYGRHMELESFLGFGEEEFQKEFVGIKVWDFGSVIHGLRLEKVEGRATVSLDKLSRIVFDVFEDTSHLMSSILNLYQRRILNVIYPMLREEGFERKKYTVVVSSKIIPEVKSVEELVSEPYVTEVRQLVGRILNAFEHNGVKIVCGENGMLIIGEVDDLKWVEVYSSLRALEMFLDDLNVYLWMTWDKVTDIRRKLLSGRIEEVKNTRGELVKISSDIAILASLKGIVNYSINRLEKITSECNSEFLKRLNAERILTSIKRRSESLGDLFESIRSEIDGVIMIINTRLEESLDRLNTITFWLSVIFGVFGVGQFLIEALLELKVSPVTSILASVFAMLVVALIGFILSKPREKRGE